ncbi:MAG: L,D-transpeptidase family protein [Pseudomonadota bacterium]
MPSNPVDERDRIQLRPGERLVVNLPDGSSREVRSLLNVVGPQGFGSFVWNEDGAGTGPVWARVDLGAQTLSVFRGMDEIGTAVIVYGTSAKPTPLGWFTILDKQRDYHSRTYDAPMPWMLRLTDDGVALHASQIYKGRATHGCIGAPDEFAGRLFAVMNRGDRVLIVDTMQANRPNGPSSLSGR